MPTFPRTVDFVASDDLPVRIVRSSKRTKTISSHWRDNRLVVQVPAALNEMAERAFVDEMIKKYRQRKSNGDSANTSDALMERARSLDARYFRGMADPASVRWVDNQNKRWGSATPVRRTIRLSNKLKFTPSWVQDYVLVHELAHLAAPDDGHGPIFQKLLDRFERRQEANQYLAGFSAGFSAHAKSEGSSATMGEFDDLEDD